MSLSPLDRIAHVPPLDGPHAEGGIVTAGAPLPGTGTLILVHGRGADPESMLDLARAHQVEGWALLAPEARGRTWYPHSFLAPMSQNEPWLSSALAAVGGAVRHAREQGAAPERIVFLGFSQGACLASEWVRRNPGRWGGLVAYSGGIIGPMGTTWETPEGDALRGTPVFLGCSDVDHHIPVERVHETAMVFEAMGARVEKRIYPGMGHTVNADEVGWTRKLLASVAAPGGVAEP